jgi:hypothetical protein
LKEAADFKADTVILCIAENVPGLATQAEQERFKAAVKELLAFVKGDGSPAIYVRSGFWKSLSGSSRRTPVNSDLRPAVASAGNSA